MLILTINRLFAETSPVVTRFSSARWKMWKWLLSVFSWDGRSKLMSGDLYLSASAPLRQPSVAPHSAEPSYTKRADVIDLTIESSSSDDEEDKDPPPKKRCVYISKNEEMHAKGWAIISMFQFYREPSGLTALYPSMLMITRVLISCVCLSLMFSECWATSPLCECQTSRPWTRRTWTPHWPTMQSPSILLPWPPSPQTCRVSQRNTHWLSAVCTWMLFKVWFFCLLGLDLFSLIQTDPQVCVLCSPFFNAVWLTVAAQWRSLMMFLTFLFVSVRVDMTCGGKWYKIPRFKARLFYVSRSDQT